VFYQYLLDADQEVRTNACFGMGVLCAVAQQHLLGQYELVLSRLSQILMKESDRRMIDNILSCLCRMIVVSTVHVPLNQVILKCKLILIDEDNRPCSGFARSFSTFAIGRRFCRSSISLYLSSSTLRETFC
jgi:hypothetical protein